MGNIILFTSMVASAGLTVRMMNSFLPKLPTFVGGTVAAVVAIFLWQKGGAVLEPLTALKAVGWSWLAWFVTWTTLIALGTNPFDPDD